VSGRRRASTAAGPGWTRPYPARSRTPPFADLLWCETKDPDLDDAERFAAAVHERFPGKALAYNCSPSFNWKETLSDEEIDSYQEKLSGWGCRFQFITLAGFHTLNFSMFELARGYGERAMAAYAALQEREFAAEDDGYSATKHQRQVGAAYFDEIAEVIAGGDVETTAVEGSKEEQQFN
jgi:isocitrate lyase